MEALKTLDFNDDLCDLNVAIDKIWSTTEKIIGTSQKDKNTRLWLLHHFLTSQPVSFYINKIENNSTKISED